MDTTSLAALTAFFVSCMIGRTQPSEVAKQPVDLTTHTADCDRIRKAMHTLTENELMLYVDGLQQIRQNGKYQIMVDAHSAYSEIHRGTSFFFYHTYFVWEVETQIRALGSKWACFAVPYYDWTIDAGREKNPLVLNTVFGGDGNAGNNNCVTDPHNHNLWGVGKWPVRELCGPPEDASVGCCLKRNLDPTQQLSAAKQVAPMIEVPFFHEFLGDILIEHQMVHWLFGHGDECVSCAMATGYSPDDPIFMMLHAFTAYLRALWASCHGYDNIDPKVLGIHPEAFVAECIDGFEDCGAIQLDEPYDFGAMVDTEWSRTATEFITPRKMWNFRDWDVKYDHGTFYDESGLRHSDVCDHENILNSEWFTHPTPPRRGRDIADLNANLNLKLNGKYRIRSVHYVDKVRNDRFIVALCSVLLVAAVMVQYGTTLTRYVRAKIKGRSVAQVQYEMVPTEQIYGSLELQA